MAWTQPEETREEALRRARDPGMARCLAETDEVVKLKCEINVDFAHEGSKKSEVARVAAVHGR